MIVKNNKIYLFQMKIKINILSMKYKKVNQKIHKQTLINKTKIIEIFINKTKAILNKIMTQ